MNLIKYLWSLIITKFLKHLRWQNNFTSSESYGVFVHTDILVLQFVMRAVRNRPNSFTKAAYVFGTTKWFYIIISTEMLPERWQNTFCSEGRAWCWWKIWHSSMVSCLFFLNFSSFITFLNHFVYWLFPHIKCFCSPISGWFIFVLDSFNSFHGHHFIKVVLQIIML